MEKKLIQSVLRAAKILDIVAECKDGIILKEIANKLKLGSSTVFYLVSTLVELGFIKQINNKYKLGPKNLHLGSNYLENLSIYKIAVPVLEDLLEKINENIYLYMIENNEFLQLIKMESAHSVKPTRISNDTNNAHSTAIGKILLSSFSKEKLEEFIAKYDSLQKFTKNTITTLDQLNKELDIIRIKGYALDTEESEICINCIAVPVYNHKGNIKASIGVSIPTQRYSNDIENKILPLLRNSAAKISNELGFKP